MRRNSFITYLLCGLILLLGIFLSIILFIFIENSNHAQNEKYLTEYFNNVENRIQQEIDKNLNVLYAFRAYYQSKNGFTRSEFAKFGEFFTMNIESIQALEWVPEVPLADRLAFEEATRAEGYPDFEIFTRDERGNIVRAEDRPFYYPIHYVHPFEGNEAAFGYDPGPSSKVRDDVIQRSIASQKTAASAIIEIIQKENKNQAILVFVPVFENTELVGFIEGVYLVDKLIVASLEDFISNEQFSLTITSNSPESEILFSNTDPFEVTKPLLFKTSEIELADRTWELTLELLDGESISLVAPLWLSIGSMLITLLAVYLTYNTLTDNRRALNANLRELRQKNIDLEQYAYVASHDLQEPLHSLQSLVDLLHDDYKDSLDTKGKQTLNYIRDSSERMSLLITSLLNYSRIGRMEEPAWVDTNSVVEEVLKQLHVQIEESKAEIKITDPLPKIWAYPLSIGLLFQNLISNAIKFQPKDQIPVITISWDDKKQQFEVKDNGIGIHKKEQSKVFVIFKRLHNSSKYAGTGVGLANCKKIIDLHKGRIWIKSAEGRGSSFYFTIKLSHETS